MDSQMALGIVSCSIGTGHVVSRRLGHGYVVEPWLTRVSSTLYELDLSFRDDRVRSPMSCGPDCQRHVEGTAIGSE